jgi:hypothetical protein
MRTDLGQSTTVAVAFGSIWVADGFGALERLNPK